MVIRMYQDPVPLFAVRTALRAIGEPEEALRALETTKFVDEYVLHDLIDRRERGPNAVPELINRHLPAGTPAQFAADCACAMPASDSSTRLVNARIRVFS